MSGLVCAQQDMMAAQEAALASQEGRLRESAASQDALQRRPPPEQTAPAASPSRTSDRSLEKLQVLPPDEKPDGSDPQDDAGGWLVLLAI